MLLNKIKFAIIVLVLFSVQIIAQTDSLLKIWKDDSKRDTLRAFALHTFARQLVFNNPDTTLILSKQLLKFSEDHHLEKYIAGALNNIALSYYAKGDYKHAIDNYSESVNKLRTIISGDDPSLKNFAKTQLGKTYNNIGNVYLDKGDYPLALGFYFQSLKVVEEMGDLRAQSVALGNVGIIYAIQKNYETSINYFFRSLKLDSILDDKSGMGSIYSNISNLYQESHQYVRSLIYQEKSLALREAINDKDGIILSLVSLGSLYSEIGNNTAGKKDDQGQVKQYFAKALEYYDKAYTMSKEMGAERNEGVALMGIGNCKIKLGETAAGIQFCEKSLAIAEKIQSDAEIKDACSCLYTGYGLQNNSAKALEYFTRYIALRDTLNSEEKIREIAQKQFEFDYNKKAVADSLRTMQQRVSIQAELKNEQTRRYYLYGGLLLVLVFAVFMYNRYQVSQKQKQIIEKQKAIVEEKQKEILDSIQYAKKIQKTLLAHESVLDKELKDYFILYKPKDIVSGDFYWATNKEERFYLAVCDSTGHGVPGAFMSLLNASLLNEAITEKNIKEPGEVFNYVRNKLIGNLSSEAQKDGMDGVLVCFDRITGKITYAAGNNKPILISGEHLTELPSDKMPVGIGERKQDFNTYPLNSKKGDCLYLFTDGYADQFGGEKGKKFKHRQLEALLAKINSKDNLSKRELLNEIFEKWRGRQEQVDDVSVIGITM